MSSRWYKVSREKRPDVASGHFVTSYRIDVVTMTDDSAADGAPDLYPTLSEAAQALEELAYPEYKPL